VSAAGGLLLHTFPADGGAVLAALTAMDSSPHMTQRLYPLIAQALAGEELTATGAVTVVLSAIRDYSADQPPVVSVTLMMLTRPILRALLPPGAFLDEALAALAAAGI
jgi:hypothetical protein